jgi:X-X-X-Leu-X-X-Gly heptad repeat protein
MNNKSMSKRLVSLVIVATMLSPNLAYANEIIEKDETVYVTLTENGKPEKTIVVDWLSSDEPNIDIIDKTTLKDIVNVKGNEAHTKKGENIIWKHNSDDIFYKGTTDKGLPIEVIIKYFLDGKEITPKELAGKSGEIKIKIQFNNKEKHIVKVGGQDKEIYTPMTVAGTLNMPMDIFNNVTISDGKIICDGKNQLISFMGFPGLEESLKLDSYDIEGFDDIDFPNEFEITADAKNFELDSIMITATPEIPDMDEFKKSEDVDDLRESLDDLKDASNKLVDGANELADGLDAAVGKLEESNDDMDEMDPNEDIRSLITDENNVEIERKLMKDCFDFYDMDKNLLDLLPNYVTYENIDLFDRIKADLDDIDIDYIIDDPFLRTLPDKFSDKNIDKARILLDDADEIKTLDLGRVLPYTRIFTYGDDLKDLAEDATDLMGKIEKNDDKVDTLKTAMYSTKGLKDLFTKQNIAMVDFSKLSPSQQGAMAKEVNDVVKLMVDPMVRAGIKAKEEKLNDAIDNDHYTKKNVKNDLLKIVTGAVEFQKESIEAKVTTTSAITVIDEAILNTKAAGGDIMPLVTLKGGTNLLINNPQVVTDTQEKQIKGGIIQIVEKGGKSLKSAIEHGKLDSPMIILAGYNADGTPNGVVKNVKYKLKHHILAPAFDKVGSEESIEETVKETSEKATKELLQEIAKTDATLRKKIGPDYMNEINESVDYFENLIPEIEVFQSHVEENEEMIDDIKDLMDNDDDLEYLQDWTFKLIDMKKDIDKNEENIQTMKEMLEKYDDPKINYAIKRFHDIEADMDAARPIIEELNEKFNEPAMNESLHNSPDMVDQLMEMKHDLEDNRRIMEIMKDAIEEDNIELANKLLDALPDLQEGIYQLQEGSKQLADNMQKFDDKGIEKLKEEATEKLDDVDELMDTKDALVKVSEDYTIFTDIGENMTGKVKFVMKTDEIKIPEPEVVEEKVNEDEEGGFVNWFKNIFEEISSFFSKK